MTIKKFKLADLASGLDVTIHGDPDCMISGIAPIQKAEQGHLTFLSNSLYKKHLLSTKASAVILSEKEISDCPVNAVISNNPYYIYARMASFFMDAPEPINGVHPSVMIGDDTIIDPTAKIGAFCVIGRRVTIAADVVIGSGCYIGDDVVINESTELDANVTLYHKVKIGKRSHISSGVVIGSEGFGFARQHHTWHKVPQLGGVEIGNDVDIGANTAIDRGALENTIIEDGVKLDNLIQIGHNVKIGANTIIAGCVGIAGSAVIGKNCMIGGAARLAGHITICDGTIVTGATGVSKSIHEPGMYSSGIVGAVPNHEFRKNNARFHRLDKLVEKVKSLELTIKELKERK